MYPTSNVNGQQSAGQPIYYPANSAQPAYSQGYVHSQVGNQQAPQPCPSQYFMGPPKWAQPAYTEYQQGVPVRQPMMYSLFNGAQYAPVYQYAPTNMGNSNAPVYNGQCARTQPISTNLRVEIPPPVFAQNESSPKDQVEETRDSTDDGSMSSTSSVESAPEVLSAKAKEFLLAVEKARVAKSLAAMNIKETSESALLNDKNEKIDPASTKMDKLSVIEKRFDEQMKMQQKILDLLQPKTTTDYLRKPTQPKSYTMALERLKVFKPEEPIAPKVARKNTSMVFIYDIDDITQLSMKILKGVRIMFPDLKHVTRGVEGVLNHFVFNFFEYSEDQDIYERMNAKDGNLSGKMNEYLEFKTKCETSGPNIIYELIKACEVPVKKRDEALNIKRQPSQHVELDQVEEFQKMFDQLWQSSKKCLQAISDKSLKKTYKNVVLCDMIGDGSAQLLLAGLASEVPLENLYSSSFSSKEAIFERIQRDYGDSCTLVVVTSNEKTIAAAEKKDIVVWPVEDEKSLDALYAAQKSHLLE